jgi:protein-tyrosine phosphatase
MVNIVVICTGNICRSPMGEGLLRDRWAKTGRTDLKVTSMGTHGLDNQPASEYARLVCGEHGIDISGHRSRQLMSDELAASHLIFTMEQVHKEFVNMFFPRVSDRIFLLGAWPGKETRKCNIEDPMGGTMKAYRRSFDIIAFHVDRILPEIVEYYN